MPARIRCLQALATNSRMSRTRSQKPFTSESPAHPWCASVRRILRSHRSGQCWSLVAGCPELPRAVSGCFVPAATFVHVPVIGRFPLVLLERRARSEVHADLRSITDPAAGSDARRAWGSEIADAISGLSR
jgi:hypothetical protein